MFDIPSEVPALKLGFLNIKELGDGHTLFATLCNGQREVLVRLACWGRKYGRKSDCL